MHQSQKGSSLNYCVTNFSRKTPENEEILANPSPLVPPMSTPIECDVMARHYDVIMWPSEQRVGLSRERSRVWRPHSNTLRQGTNQTLLPALYKSEWYWRRPVWSVATFQNSSKVGWNSLAGVKVKIVNRHRNTVHCMILAVYKSLTLTLT